MDFKKTATAFGIAALTGAAALTVLPSAQARNPAPYDGVQFAACNPCNPCAPADPKKKVNPCAASNPGNPCAAGNPCNPCGPSNPCNPCAAQK